MFKNELGIVMLLDKPTTVTRGASETPSIQVTTQPEQNTEAKLINRKIKKKYRPIMLYSSEGLLAIWK